MNPFDHAWADGRTYLTLASQVVGTGDYATSSKPGTGSGGTRGPTALFPPAYPYFLAAVDLFDGQRSDLKAAAGPGRVSQAILGTLTVGLIGLVALEAFGGEAALVALVLAAVYPVLIETSAVLLAENLLIALMLAAVYCGLRVRRAAHPHRWIALSGVFTGLAALTHQNALVLLPPLALAAWSSCATRASRTRGLAVLALATALTVAPWTIRNAVELRSFIPISDQAGETVFGTYNPVSAANTRVPYKWWPPSGVTTAKAKALVEQAPSLREPEWESRLMSQALGYIRAHPLSPLSASFHNALQLLELGSSFAWEASAASIGLNRGTAEIAIVGFWVYTILAVLGALTPSARRAPKWLWLVPILYLLSTVWVRAETPRFRLPIDPFLILLASLALASALQRARPLPRRAPVGSDASPAGAWGRCSAGRHAPPPRLSRWSRASAFAENTDIQVSSAARSRKPRTSVPPPASRIPSQAMSLVPPARPALREFQLPGPAAAVCSLATSPALSRRYDPAFRSPSSSGPNATRSSRPTGCPTASHIRRTCRLRPSWSVSSIVSAASSRTRAGALRPSSSSTPSRSASSACLRTGACPTLAR